MSFVLMGAALAPTILILWYFYRRDLNPEPHGALLRTFGWGLAICLPAALLELAEGATTASLQLSPMLASVNEAFFSAALVDTVRLRSSSDSTRREEAAPMADASMCSAYRSMWISASLAGARARPRAA